MKVLLVTGIYPPDVGGPATFVPRLARWLTDRGHEVSVLTLTDAPYTRTEGTWSEIRILRSQPRPVRMLRVAWALRRMGMSADAIFVNGLFEEVALSGIAKRRRVVAKVVGDPVWERAVRARLTSLGVTEFNCATGSMRTLFERALLVWALNQFHQILTPSPTLAETIEMWRLRTPVAVVVNGVPDAETAPSASHLAAEFDIACASRLVNIKQIELLIQASAAASASLLVVGDGPERQRLQECAKLHGGRVEFRGSVPSEQVVDELRRARVFGQFSTTEGLSFSLLHAMSLGKPCLVSDIESHRFTLGQTGVFVDPTDVTACARSLRQLLDSPQQQRELGHATRTRFRDQFLESTSMARTEEWILDGFVRS